MNRLLSLLTLTIAILLASCSGNKPEFANSIPDDAVAVISVHPMQLHDKGKINSLENLKAKVEDEVYILLIENPLSSGVMLNEYCYFFMTMEEEAPVIGLVAGMRDVEKFEAILGKIREDIETEFVEGDQYTWLQPDEEGIVAWNDERIVILGSPDEHEFEASYWTGRLDWMFSPVKEESLVSMVDFKDFQSNMKDVNLWLSTGEIAEIAEKFMDKDIGEMPFKLENNYSHMYCEFANGAVNITGKTNFSDEVQKNLDEVLVFKSSLNKDLLKMTPGGNLLMALSVSADLEKIKELGKKFPDADLGKLGTSVEESTGIPAETWLEALSGDLTLAINGLEGDEMIPVEIFIGLGVNSSEIQEKLMENMEQMVPVENEGDFFIINIQGNEIYSGILHDTWVLTNAKGYKDRVESGSIDKSLMDSRFKDYSDGSMGLFLNLDLESYPASISEMLNQVPEQKTQVNAFTDPFESLGISAGGDQNQMILKTTRANENSLYTLLKLADSQAGK